MAIFDISGWSSVTEVLKFGNIYKSTPRLPEITSSNLSLSRYLPDITHFNHFLEFLDVLVRNLLKIQTI